MRLFFGVPVDDSVRNRVAIAQDHLRSAAEKVKWVEPANFHLTLRFIGNVPDADVDPIIQAAEGVDAGLLPVRLALRGVGAFPDPRRARVVWVGLSEGQEALRQVSRSLDERLKAALGIPPEPRDFVAHLTIGRVKVPRVEEALAASIGEFQAEDFGGYVADRFVLYQSTLTPRGSVYRVVRTYGAPPPEADVANA